VSPRLNWLWPVLVVALFCLPLFARLDGLDLRGDEAAHSFSVDRILETGDWLIPKGSPGEDEPFLEKPPLKFWIIAAGIRSGLLPHTDVGLRFWDALFGSVAFFYVFLIGRRLAGPVCGATAVLILFIHEPLLFDHGLRGNNMEAALVLCYCGSFYHYLAWTADSTPRRRWHAIALALCFTLGFMVKFVAALFVPAVLAVASLAVPSYRARVARDWRLWSAVSLLALALIAPWFAYADHMFGARFWHVIFGAHVYTRLTAGLDPAHVQSGGYYFSQLTGSLKHSGARLLAVAGGILLLIETIRRRWAEGFVILLWFALPFGAISLLTSKLYYYADPFLPPVALAGGYFMTICWLYFPPRIPRVVDDTIQRATTWAPRVMAARHWLGARLLLLGIATAAGAIMAWTLTFGSARISIAGTVWLRNSNFLRPWLVVLACGALASRSRQVGRLLTVPLLMTLLMPPLQGYRETLTRIAVENHPMRSARDCIQRIRSDAGSGPSVWRGLYIAGPDSAFGHELYYFRGLRPWERAQTPTDETLRKYLYDPLEQRPVLVDGPLYTSFTKRLASSVVPSARDSRVDPGTVKIDDVRLLLPGVYAVCGDTRASSTPR
jgi:4-amino-4-deoxy-L-arabinose transferase-like glycosyltransferase